MTTLPLLLTFFFQSAPGYTVGGVVIHAVSGQPLAKTRVMLTSEVPGPVIAPVVTGADGRFRFDRLRAGKYTMSAERLGFARQSFRQKALYQSYSTGIVVGEASTDNLIFPLIPGASLSGYVKDSRGEPVPGMTVQALRVAGFGKQRRVTQAFVQTTDDRGYYRVPSLARGSYAVVVSGRPWQAQEVAALDPVAYPVTFYPNTPNPDAAGTIDVFPGQEARADVTVPVVATARLIGEIPKPSDGARFYVALMAPSLFGLRASSGPSQWVIGSRFEFDQLPEGHYRVNLVREGGVVAGWREIDVKAPETNLTIGEVPPANVTVRVSTTGTSPNPSAPMIVALQSRSVGAGISKAAQPDGAALFPAVPVDRYVPTVTQRRPLAVIGMKTRGATQTGRVVEIPDTGDVEIELIVDTAAPDLNGRLLRNGVQQAGILTMLVQRDTWAEIGAYRFDQTDSDGTFIWRAVPRGEYYMFAFETGEPVDYDDPSVIRDLLPMAQKLTVTGDPKQSVVLEIQNSSPATK